MDYSRLLQKVILDMARHIPDFQNIKPSRILVSSTPSRGPDKKGLWACILPLRFENGKKVKFERSGSTVRRYSIQLPAMRAIHPTPGEHFLYFMYVSTPRFYKLSLDEKLETLIHELYHINPEFNGDLRRFPNTKYMHGSSIRTYDQYVRKLKKYYLQKTRAKNLLSTLSLSQRSLLRANAQVEFPRYKEPEQNIVQVNRR